MDRGTVLQRAAWFLATHEKTAIESSDPEKPRGLASVSRTIQRTGSQLRRTRLFHLFYIFVLPIYTVIGAWIFKTLDGEHDDRLIEEFNNRCDLSRNVTLDNIRLMCRTGDECFNLMKNYLEKVERCYKNWHLVNRTTTHSMNDFTNALVYAFSVYTTIGYGNMAADTTQCRMATIVYGAFGIPLFFAFVKEEGNLFRNVFIYIYNRISKWRRKHCGCRCGVASKDVLGRPLLHGGLHSKKARFSRKYSTASMLGQKSLSDEQRRVFIAGVLFFILYILLSSFFFSISTEFDYITSVYFLFNSVALIGFGDVFPQDPRTILINAVFIVFGVVLFSMCYFILQEEIRNKAFEASRKARISISKYSHTILQHASRGAWSRRNSPLLEMNPQSAFDRLRKRRQSAPVLTLTVPTDTPREC
ncbi:Ion channel [Dictyocaulus viviparus]|uniref:Ion channel n=1 Tax=Dictyocaulus viviparus TaxID=29172 RepID=A0A0D8XBY0_DICVI|nr:Ion channel [Dictyocaulus viviparus]